MYNLIKTKLNYIRCETTQWCTYAQQNINKCRAKIYSHVQASWTIPWETTGHKHVVWSYCDTVVIMWNTWLKHADKWPPRVCLSQTKGHRVGGATCDEEAKWKGRTPGPSVPRTTAENKNGSNVVYIYNVNKTQRIVFATNLGKASLTPH